MVYQTNEGILSPYLRKKRFDIVKSHLNGRVLDVGSGAGGLAELVTNNNYVGVEIDQCSRDLAKTLFPTHTFVAGLADALGKFDTIAVLPL